MSCKRCKPHFTARPALVQLGAEWFMTVEPLTFWVSDSVQITVPAGFVTDLASIPLPVRSIISKTDAHIRSAIVHDYLLSRRVLSRVAIDGLFVDFLTADGLPGWKIKLMYIGVRIGSYFGFKSSPPVWVADKARTEKERRNIK